MTDDHATSAQAQLSMLLVLMFFVVVVMKNHLRELFAHIVFTDLALSKDVFSVGKLPLSNFYFSYLYCCIIQHMALKRRPCGILLCNLEIVHFALLAGLP